MESLSLSPCLRTLNVCSEKNSEKNRPITTLQASHTVEYGANANTTQWRNTMLDTTACQSIASSTICPICLDRADESCGKFANRSVVRTACQPVAHHYHLECITDWFKTRKDNERICALCKQTAVPLVRVSGVREVEESPLCEAAALHATRNGDLATLQQMLKKDPGIANRGYRSAIAGEGIRLLFIATQEGHTACMEALMEAGADVNFICPSDGTSCLHVAALQGHIACLQALIRAGANLDTIDFEGYSPLCIATEEGHIACLQALIRAGANPSTANNDGFTPLVIAAQKVNIPCVILLSHAIQAARNSNTTNQNENAG